MPLNNRYVLAAFDTQGERLAFLSPSFDWVQSAREAVIFQSQMDAKQFIISNSLSDNAESKTPALDHFDHVQALFVTVNSKDAGNSDNPDEGISFTGIYG